MAEWLYEAGIGETRAALVEDDTIIEAVVEVDDGALRVGTVLAVRLVEVGALRGLVRSIDGKHEAMLEPPPAIDTGRAFHAVVVREAIAEPGAVKRARVRLTDDDVAAGPDLRLRIVATGISITAVAVHGPDLLEAAGWSECLEAAACGALRFAGGALRISLTPAMTLIDVDGELPPYDLALAGAAAAGTAIRRFGIGGSIGIDLPSVGGKAERRAIAEAFDAVLPPPFERTAVNGFGFLQIIRPRPRTSLCEQLHYGVPGAEARALLRRAQRSGLVGATQLVAPNAVEAVLAAHPEWQAALAAQLGGPVTLRADPALAMSGAYAAKAA